MLTDNDSTRKPNHSTNAPADLTAKISELKIPMSDESDKKVIGTRRQASLLKTGALQDAIVNSANFSSIATDAQGVIQIFNFGAERMLGYSAADVIGKMTPADISDPQELIARADALSLELGTLVKSGFEALVFKASRGIEDIYELTYVRKDGSRFPAVVSVTTLRDAQDEIIGYLLIGTDNIARKKIEAERTLLKTLLNKNEERFKLMIEGSEQVLYYTRGMDHRFTYLSPSTTGVLGYQPGDLVGKTYDDFQIADDVLNINSKALIIKTLQDGLPFKPYFVAARHKDGLRIVCEIVESPVLEDNKIMGFQGFARDVTERVEAQKQLTSSETRFRSFFDQAAVGMVIASESGKFLRVNQRFADIIGYTKEEIVGNLCAMATHPDDREHEAVSIARLIGGLSDGLTWEKRYLRKDGSAVWCKLSLSMSVEDDHSRQFIGVVEDISDKKTAEETLRRSQAMLRIAGQTAKLGGWMLDLPGHVLHWSEEVRAICEVPPDFEPTIAQSIEFCPVEYRDEFKKQIADCARYGTPVNLEREMITATGRRIWVLTTGIAMRDEQGSIVAVQGALQGNQSANSVARSRRRDRQ